MVEGELTAISRALAFQKEAAIDSVPISLEKYLAAAKAELTVRYDLDEDEAGQTFPVGDKHFIIVNGNHSPERQRFTVLHEIAHIKLGLPSKHGSSLSIDQLLRYRNRPREEILCDIFASECLLPRQFFLPDVRKRPCSMQSVRDLANLYEASIPSTGSRFAAYNESACAWILADDRYIRFVSSSTALREARFWVQIGAGVPPKSVLGRLIAGDVSAASGDSVPAYVWTNNDCKGIDEFTEEVILVSSLSQGVSLLHAEDIIMQRDSVVTETSEDDELLPELDGILQFHKRIKRR